MLLSGTLAEAVLENAEAFNGEFVSQNCKVKEDALFDYELAEFGDFRKRCVNFKVN